MVEENASIEAFRERSAGRLQAYYTGAKFAMQYTFASQYFDPPDTRRSHTKDSANVSIERPYSFRIACHLTIGNRIGIIIVTPSSRVHHL